MWLGARGNGLPKGRIAISDSLTSRPLDREEWLDIHTITTKTLVFNITP